jgi:hypothetical protein
MISIPKQERNQNCYLLYLCTETAFDIAGKSNSKWYQLFPPETPQLKFPLDLHDKKQRAQHPTLQSLISTTSLIQKEIDAGLSKAGIPAAEEAYLQSQTKQTGQSIEIN